MSSWAKPGVKCVCVKGGTPSCYGFKVFGAYPIVGGVYTVRGVYRGTHWDQVYLTEFPASSERHPDGCELGWNIDHFRPLVTRTQEQDLALFRHLLSPSPVDVGLVPAGVELDA